MDRVKYLHTLNLKQLNQEETLSLFGPIPPKDVLNTL